MRNYSQSEVDSKFNALREEIIQAGWDGAYPNLYEVTANTEKELCSKLLNQGEVFGPQPLNLHKTERPVQFTGASTSFAGILVVDCPNLQTVFSNVQMNEFMSEELAEAASEIMTDLLLGTQGEKTVEVAEERARLLVEADARFKPVLRGFVRTLTPYKYAEDTDAQ